MKFAIKSLAVAAALVAATSAHATFDLASTENSSLIFLALDATGAQVGTLGVDLGLNLNNFIPTFGAPGAADYAGKSLSWNFATNTFTVDGVAQNATAYGSANGQFNWSNAWATFGSVAQLGESKWAVVAGDNANGLRYATTGNPTNADVQAQTLSKTSTMANGLLMIGVANLGDNANGNVGAYVSTSGTGYVGGTTGNVLRTDGKWATGLNWAAWTNTGTAASTTEFNYIDVQPRTGSADRATITTYGNNPLTTVGVYSGATQYAADAGRATPTSTGVISTFQFDPTTATLTWTPGVPEPETYALLAAGLLTMGALARRRQA